MQNEDHGVMVKTILPWSLFGGLLPIPLGIRLLSKKQKAIN